MSLTTDSDATAAVASVGGAAGAAPSLHDTSAGRISVATWRGGPYAAAIASAASRLSSAVDWEVRTQVEKFRATVSMSDWSCASYWVWYVAWSPTMLTSGTFARRALWRFASPLPRPEPRCSSVAAGLSVIRAYPSAAPVATPSNRASTARISGTESSAATKCISEVPGFVNEVVTPASTSVRIRAWAPFTARGSSHVKSCTGWIPAPP